MMFRFLQRNKINVKPWFSKFLYFLKKNREIMWSQKRETMIFRFLDRNRLNIKDWFSNSRYFLKINREIMPPLINYDSTGDIVQNYRIHPLRFEYRETCQKED